MPRRSTPIQASYSALHDAWKTALACRPEALKRQGPPRAQQAQAQVRQRGRWRARLRGHEREAEAVALAELLALGGQLLDGAQLQRHRALGRARERLPLAPPHDAPAVRDGPAARPALFLGDVTVLVLPEEEALLGRAARGRAVGRRLVVVRALLLLGRPELRLILRLRGCADTRPERVSGSQSGRSASAGGGLEPCPGPPISFSRRGSSWRSLSWPAS